MRDLSGLAVSSPAESYSEQAIRITITSFELATADRERTYTHGQAGFLPVFLTPQATGQNSHFICANLRRY